MRHYVSEIMMTFYIPSSSASRVYWQCLMEAIFTHRHRKLTEGQLRILQPLWNTEAEGPPGCSCYTLEHQILPFSGLVIPLMFLQFLSFIIFRPCCFLFSSFSFIFLRFCFSYLSTFLRNFRIFFPIYFSRCFILSFIFRRLIFIYFIFVLKYVYDFFLNF